MDGRILKVNRVLATLIGADPRDIEGRDLCGLAHPDDRALCRSKMAALRASRDAVRFELRLAWDAEHEVWADLHLAVIEDPDDADPGCIACILDADRDPLARRDGAAHPDLMPLTNALAVELATSPLLSDIRQIVAKRLKHMTGATAVFFSEYDAEDRVLVPMAAEIDSRLLNKGLEILGRDLSDVKSPVNAEMHAEIVATTVGYRRTLSEATFGAVGRLAGAAVQKIMRADRFIGLAHVVDGRLYGTSMLAMPAGVPNPPHDWLESIANIFAVALRRRLAEQELAESESRFRSYLEHAPIGIFVHDASGRFLQVNPAACRVTGYDRASLLAMGIQDLTAPESRAEADAALRRVVDGKVVRVEVKVTHADGQERLLAVASARLSKDLILGFVDDITQIRQLQANLAQADRTNSMGILAASVSHEINNPLSYVLYNLESLDQDLPGLLGQTGPTEADAPPRSSGGGHPVDPETVQDVLERFKDALEGSKRIASIAHSLSTFSRVEKDTAEPIDVERSIRHAVTMARNEIRYRAELVTDLEPVPAVLGSEGKLSQVFLNMLINAAHAVDEDHAEENEIRIRTWADEDDVWIEIADTGRGIAPQDQARIFEPFFSTKDVGEGSGLGLSICKNIVTSFGGDISFTSEPGVGTRFLVSLPHRTTDDSDRRDRAAGTEQAQPERRGRILVIDDEPGIRAALVRVLKTEHEVVTASSGEAARDLLRTDRRFDVIYCDLMMPGVSGMQLHAWLREQDTQLADRVVFISGGAFTPEAAQYLAKADNRRVEKPFEADKLKKLTSDLVLASRSTPTHADPD